MPQMPQLKRAFLGVPNIFMLFLLKIWSKNKKIPQRRCFLDYFS
nr:MAG TPA: hypothetical protein [Caudoviricetes sp.]